VLNRLAPQGRRNVIFAVKQTGVPIGGVLAGILLPALALGLGWRAALTCCAVGTVLVALALSPLRAAWDARRDPAAPFLSAGGNSVAALSRNRALRALAVVGAIYAAVQLSFAAYLVTMLVEEFAWGAVAAGAASATAQASGAVGRLGWAALADRAGGRGMTVLALTGICTAAGLLGLLLAGSDWPPDGMLLALLCFVGACSLGWNGVLLAEAARLAPQGNAGRGVGAVLSITFVGVMVGPPLIGLGVSALGSYAAAFGVAALVALIGAAIALSARGQA
jgi:MFS family permease